MKDKEEIRKLYLAIEEEFNTELVKLVSYKEIVNRRNTTEELLNNCLNENEYKIFDEYISIESEMESFEMQQAFIKGFVIAYKLLIDSLR